MRRLMRIQNISEYLNISVMHGHAVLHDCVIALTNSAETLITRQLKERMFRKTAKMSKHA